MPILRIVALMISALAALDGLSQQANSTASPDPSSPSRASADMMWSTLKHVGTLSAVSSSKPTASRQEIAADLLARADQLKSFRTQFPSHEAIPEARRLETILLSWAAINGDSRHEQRRVQLLDEVRSDARLPVERRFEAVAWSRRASLAPTPPASHEGNLRDREHIARALIAEFPPVPEGYESLLSVAREGSAETGRKIASELLSPPAPAHIASEAALLLRRFDLIGRRVLDLLSEADAHHGVTLRAGEPAIVYSWSDSYPAGHALIKRYASRFPQAGFLGICLGRDVTRARLVATTANLPGPQIFDSQGPAGAVARRLAMTHPIHLYLVNASGVLVDVCGHIDTRKKLNLSAP